MRVSFASQLLYETATIQLTVSLAIYLFIYSLVYNSFISVFLASFIYKCVISWYHIFRIYKYTHKTDIYGLFIEHIYIYEWIISWSWQLGPQHQVAPATAIFVQAGAPTH